MTGEPSPPAPMSRGDDDHGQGHHDGLVQTGQDGRHGQGNLDLEEHLPAGGPEGLCRFHQFGMHATDTEAGQPDDGEGRAKMMVANTPRHITDRKEHDDGHQIDESRGGLHGVKHGPEICLKPVAAPGHDAEGNAEQAAYDDRGKDHGQGNHGIFPQAEKSDEQHGCHGKDRQPLAGDSPGDQADHADDDGRMQGIEPRARIRSGAFPPAISTSGRTLDGCPPTNRQGW